MGGTENTANISGSASGISSAAGYGGTAINAYGAGANAAQVGPTMANAGYGVELPSSGMAGGVADVITDKYDTFNAATEYPQYSEPSALDNLMNYYDRFTKGMNQTLPEAYKKFGNNPETWGYGFGKVTGAMGGGGKSEVPQAPAMVTNVNYQQPENEYLKRYAKRRMF